MESTSLVKVPFDEGEILCIQNGNGEHVVLKPLCERLGIDAQAQQRRIMRATWGRKGAAIMAVPSAGGVQQTFCLHRKRLAMWLATLDANRTRVEVRPYLEALQERAADVLDAYFSGHPTLGPSYEQGLREGQDQARAALSEVMDRLAAAVQRSAPKRYSAPEWAKEAGVHPSTAHRWRQAAGLSGDLSRGQWEALSTTYEPQQDPALIETIVSELRQHPRGLTTEHLAELIDACEADILLCLRAHRDQVEPRPRGRAIWWSAYPQGQELEPIRRVLSGMTGEVTTRAVLEALGQPVHHGTQKQVARALKALGYVPAKTLKSGTQARCYVKRVVN